MIKRLFLALLLSLSPLLLTQSAYAEEMAVASQAEPVNINKADAQTLAGSLVGVGLARAEEIVRYCEAYGPFYSVDDLLEVRGIGRTTLDKNRDRITLE